MGKDSSDHGQENGTKSATITELPRKVYNDALNELISKHFGASHEECSVAIDAGSAKGDNYIGIVYRVTAKHPSKGELSVIVKLPPDSATVREQLYVRPCFLRESEFYDAVFPLFTKFQQEQGIDVKKDGFYQAPRCLKSLTDDSLEALYLEDLKVTGFEMFDRFQDPTADHVNRVMEVLGKFHAISLALKDQQPETLAPFQKIHDIFLERDEKCMELIRLWFDSLKKQAMDVLNACDNNDLVRKTKEVLDADFFEESRNFVKSALAEPYAVICHGDCWNNNIMYRNENGVPVECRLLDWQIMRYASPVCDLMYHIFGCTTKELRDKHYDDFISTYHKSLTDYLKRLGPDSAKLFPRSALDDQLKRFAKFGLFMAIIVLPIFTSNPEDIPDMDSIANEFKTAQDSGEKLNEDAVQYSSSRTIDRYNKRMDGVFQDMYRLGYL